MRDKIIVRAHLAVSPFIAFFAASSFLLYKTDFFQQVYLRWQTALIIIKDNWLWGTGFGNYAFAAFPYAHESSASAVSTGNIFLKIFAETGIFGLCAFCAVLCVFFYCALKKLKLFENKELLLPVLLAVVSFLLYAFFDSSVFASTNIILFFILAAFPIAEYEIVLRKNKIKFYLLAVCLIPLFAAVIKPVYAQRQYQKGISFFTAQKYLVAYEYYLNALNNDCLNPEYASKISDNYFALYHDFKNPINLNAAIEYEKYALSLNAFNAKYYAQLAWLYHFKGEKELASEYISKAVEIDGDNELYRQAYGELIY
jgi:tetratricopeptide (TPR) repeat protein